MDDFRQSPVAPDGGARQADGGCGDPRRVQRLYPHQRTGGTDQYHSAQRHRGRYGRAKSGGRRQSGTSGRGHCPAEKPDAQPEHSGQRGTTGRETKLSA